MWFTTQWWKERAEESDRQWQAELTRRAEERKTHERWQQEQAKAARELAEETKKQLVEDVEYRYRLIEVLEGIRAELRHVNLDRARYRQERMR